MNPIHQPARNDGKYAAAVAGLFTSIPTPDERMFFFHEPTGIFAELLLNAGPGGHVARTATEGQIPESAFTAIAAQMERIREGSSAFLAVVSRPDFTATFPEHVILVSITGPQCAIIHYPAIGFTAGLFADGRKLAPQWKDPAVFTPEQRTHFLAQASDTLMRAIAEYAKRQAT